MANLTGKGGRKFQKGQSGNPGGVSKVARAMKNFQKLSHEEFLTKLQLFGSATKAQLQEILDDPETKVFDLIFIKILHDAVEGKSDARQVLLERLWGKVKEMDITPVFAEEHNMMKRIPVAELILLARKYSTEIATEHRNHLSD